MELKGIITKMKTLLRGLTSRFEPKEENISKLEDKPVEIIQCKEQKQTNKQNGK